MTNPTRNYVTRVDAPLGGGAESLRVVLSNPRGRVEEVPPPQETSKCGERNTKASTLAKFDACKFSVPSAIATLIRRLRDRFALQSKPSW